MVVVVGLLSVVGTLDQVILIWSKQDASGVSLVSWSLYSTYAVIFLAYGIVHREKVIIITYSAAAVADIAIVIGVLLYG